MAQELRIGTSSSRKRITVKKNQRSPLPEIFVPELRPGGLPLIATRSAQGPRRRSPESGARALSARAARSSDSRAEGFPIAPQSARTYDEIRGTRDGQHDTEHDRAGLSSALPRLEGGRGALPRVGSAASWQSVNPEEPPSPADQQLLQASRVLQRGSDPKVWLQKFVNLEETAALTVLPGVHVTAVALNLMARLADVLPAHRDLIKELVGCVETAIYPEFCPKASPYGVNALTYHKRGRKVGVPADASIARMSSKMSIKQLQTLAGNRRSTLAGARKSVLPGMGALETLNAVLDSQASTPDTDEDEWDDDFEVGAEVATADVIGDAEYADRESLKELMRQMSVQIPEDEAVTPVLQASAKTSAVDLSFPSGPPVRATLPDENWLLNLENLPSRVNSKGQKRRKVMNSDRTSPEQNMPERYKECKPHFAITRKQRWQLTRVKDKLQWVNEICSNIEGRRVAQNLLLDFLHEMTHGSIRVWCFAFWKISAVEVATFTKQCKMLKSVNRAQMGRVLHHWRLVSTCQALNKRLQEVQDRKYEMDSLKIEVENVATIARDVSISLDVSEGNCERSDYKLQMLRKVRQELDGSLSLMQPEVLKRVLPHLLEAWLHSFVIVAQSKSLKCKSAMMNKDLTHLVLHDEETSSKVAKLPCEELLIRWVNYLLVEIKYCAADLLDSAVKDHVSDVRSAWSTKDSSIFCNRCRLVRALYLVENLGSDLRDGTVLTALCAMLKAKRVGQTAFDPADLAALDERDPDLKAAEILTLMHALAPNIKARCLLRRRDIQSGNRPVLVKFLAALFLHEAPGLKDAARKDMQSKGDNGGAMTKQQVMYFHSLMTKGTAEEGQEEEEEVEDEEEEEEEPPMLRAFNTLQEAGGSVCFEQLEDPTRLLRKGEDFADLKKVSVQDLLLRWLNVHIMDQGRGFIKNFSSDLSDGWILLALITKVASDVVKVAGISDANLRVEAHSVEAVLECGPRVVDPFLLTEEAIHSGRDDLLLHFVGNLFLSRPTLKPMKGTVIERHVKVAENILQHGFEVFSTSEQTNGFEILRGFCAEMREEREELTKAVPAILEYTQVMNDLQYRVKVFLTEASSKEKPSSSTLQGPAHKPPVGRPDLARMTVMSSEALPKLQKQRENVEGVVEGVLQRRSSSKRGSAAQLLPTESVDVYTERAQLVVRQQSRLFQEMYNFYSITLDSGSEPRLPLEGIMRIYQVCRLRCPCVCLSPRLAEATYWEVLEKDLPPWRQANTADVPGSELVLEGLSVRGFIRWVLRVATHRCEALSKKGQQVDFATCLSQLADRHLKPHACQAPADEFGRLSQENEVRAVFMAREMVLWPIFEFYSTKVERDSSDDRAAILEEDEDEDYEGEDLGEVMEVDALIAALEDAGQLKKRITKELVESICMNVFAQAGSGNNESLACPSVQGDLMITASQAWNKARLLSKWVKLTTPNYNMDLNFDPRKGFKVRTRSIKRWSERQGRASILAQTLGKLQPTPEGAEEEEKTDTKPKPKKKRAATLEEAGMSYFDFLNALLALSLHSNPNPFVSTKMRVEQFLHKCFVPGIIAYCRRIVDNGPPTMGNQPEQEAYFKHQDLLESLTDKNVANEVLQLRRNMRQRAFAIRATVARPRSSDSNDRRNTDRRETLIGNTPGKKGRRTARTTESVLP